MTRNIVKTQRKVVKCTVFIILSKTILTTIVVIGIITVTRKVVRLKR